MSRRDFNVMAAIHGLQDRGFVIVSQAEQRAGYRILAPGQLDAETLERVAEFTQNEFQRDFESPVGWRGQFVAALRTLEAQEQSR